VDSRGLTISATAIIVNPTPRTATAAIVRGEKDRLADPGAGFTARASLTTPAGEAGLTGASTTALRASVTRSGGIDGGPAGTIGFAAKNPASLVPVLAPGTLGRVPDVPRPLAACGD
jgi:hypothetical protein